MLEVLLCKPMVPTVRKSHGKSEGEGRGKVRELYKYHIAKIKIYSK